MNKKVKIFLRVFVILLSIGAGGVIYLRGISQQVRNDVEYHSYANTRNPTCMI